MGSTTRFAVICCTLLVAACESPFAPGRDADPELESLPRALSVAERAVIQGSNGFAFDILRETVRQQPAANIFLSPLSASMALGMFLVAVRERFSGTILFLGAIGDPISP